MHAATNISDMRAAGAQVRKSYEEKRRRRKARGEQRAWKLKRMAMEAEEEPGTTGRGRDARAAPRHEQDLERFMQVGIIMLLLPCFFLWMCCFPGLPVRPLPVLGILSLLFMASVCAYMRLSIPESLRHCMWVMLGA